MGQFDRRPPEELMFPIMGAMGMIPLPDHVEVDDQIRGSLQLWTWPKIYLILYLRSRNALKPFHLRVWGHDLKGRVGTFNDLLEAPLAKTIGSSLRKKVGSMVMPSSSVRNAETCGLQGSSNRKTEKFRWSPSFFKWKRAKAKSLRLLRDNWPPKKKKKFRS